MIYATIQYEETEQLACVDRTGNRVFLLKDFFSGDGSDFSIASNGISSPPKTMLDLISNYDEDWTDDIALYFGHHTEYAIPLEEVQLVAPIPHPLRNIICLGKNYRDHVEEMKHFSGIGTDLPPAPIYFTKATHTVVGPGADILRHEGLTEKLDYEAELAVIIGKDGINIAPEDAEEYIFGYTIANDVSARDLQTERNQWFKGKSLATHCPIGPWIVYKTVLPFPLKLDIKSYVNGDLRQDSNTSQLIFDLPHIISDLSQGFPLQAGDIILTGTPSGVGMGMDPPCFLQSGDEVCCMVEGIGALANPIR